MLQPGQRANVAVEFVPLEDRQHTLKLPLKVSQSPRTKLIAFSGSGVQSKVEFDPPLIDLRVAGRARVRSARRAGGASAPRVSGSLRV